LIIKDAQAVIVDDLLYRADASAVIVAAEQMSLVVLHTVVGREITGLVPVVLSLKSTSAWLPASVPPR